MVLITLSVQTRDCDTILIPGQTHMLLMLQHLFEGVGRWGLGLQYSYCRARTAGYAIFHAVYFAACSLFPHCDLLYYC
jgi:hypothetical protein